MIDLPNSSSGVAHAAPPDFIALPAQSLLRRLTRFKRARSAIDLPTAGAVSTPEPGSMTGFWRGLRGAIEGPMEAGAKVNLALQGGGAHGAFTWGVLDALLDDPRLAFEGLSGSSAGAMNAVVLANGWMLGGPKNGRESARQGLADFWNEIGKQMPLGMSTQGEGDAISLSPGSRWLANWAGYFSPSQLNPLALNPLRDLLERQIDFEQLRGNSPFKLFVGATRANSGKLRVFREHELSLDVLMASSCLPKISRPVEIEGEPYWDGGYSANPAVSPLLFGCDATDVLLVLLSPLQHQDTPNSVEQIESRIVELGFSANFMREMQMFTQVADYSRPAFLSRDKFTRRLQKMRFHMIDSSGLPSLQRTETKLLAHAPFLELLRGQGQERGGAWLAASADSVGRHSTVDMGKLFN